MKTIKRFFQFTLTFLALLALVSAFFFVFNLFAAPNDFNGSLLKSPSPLPTPAALEDTPLYLYLQQHQAELLAPASSDNTSLPFAILPGELPTDVAKRLEGQGIINDADLFVQYVKYLKVGPKIQAGEYLLRRSMAADEIVQVIQHGRAKTITLTIRPGWRAEEIADYLATLGLTTFNRDQFLATVRSGKSDYAFLRDRPKGALPTMEGFLFPETYTVPYDISVDALIAFMLDTFNQRVSDKYRKEAAAAKLTLYEVVTLASIVERETTASNERPIVAGIFLTRLKKKIPLQSDVTVLYALDYQPAGKPTKLPTTSEEFVRVDSPYNTYLHAGLPPGAISNPALSAIVAVVEPAATDYLYFYAKGDGTNAFAKTYEEHQENVKKYGGK